MNAKVMESLREQLLARRDELLVDLRRHTHAADELQDREDRDAADQANAAVARELTSQIVRTEDHLLEEVEAALERMQEGQYGVCTHCGQKIPIDRLRAKPSVLLCVPCQQEKEKQR